jgi:GT2 family glycosyltransferase
MQATVPGNQAVGVVVVTHNRVETAMSTLGRLRALAERPPIVVVDNASTDGTPDAIERRYPDVDLIRLDTNHGAVARTFGVRHLPTTLVAFNDDDSWWAPGALATATALFEAHPRLAVLAARVLVGPERRTDPTTLAMADSPLPREGDLPGIPVLGFLACGAVVRRDAFLSVGGFDSHYGTSGEEHLVAVDLAAAGWGLAYVNTVVAHHHPCSAASRSERRHQDLRNAYWSTWLRRPVGRAVTQTAKLLRQGDAERWRAFGAALRGLPWVLRSRAVVPRNVEAALELLPAPGTRPG